MKFIKIVKITSIVFLFVIIIIGCSKQDSNIYVSSYEKNYELQVIDTLTYNNSDSLYLGLIKDFEVWNNNILITDHVLKKLWVFDLNFNLIQTFGSEGRGPQEFSFAPNIFTNNKNLFLIDYRLKKVVILDKNYSYVKSIRLPSEFNYWMEKPISIGKNIYISGSKPFPKNIKKFFDYSTIIKLDKHFNYVDDFFKWDNYYRKETSYSYYNRFTIIVEGPDNTLFAQQGAVDNIAHFNNEDKLLKTFRYKPKLYKDPPDIEMSEIMKSIEATAKFGAMTTRLFAGDYNKKDDLLLFSYVNWKEESWTAKDKLAGEYSVVAFDASYNCVFDEKIDGIFGACDDKGILYVIIDEKPLHVKITKNVFKRKK